MYYVLVSGRFQPLIILNHVLCLCVFLFTASYNFRLCLFAVIDCVSAFISVQNHILNLPMSDYTDLMNKVKTEQCTTYEEANDVLMTKLRIMCEIRQIEHVHGKETDVSVSYRVPEVMSFHSPSINSNVYLT